MLAKKQWACILDSLVEIKTLLLVACLLCGWSFESWRPLQHGDERALNLRLRHAVNNFMMAVVSTLVSRGLALVTLLYALQWSQQQGVGLLAASDLPVAFNWLAALLLIDIWQYGWHVMNHRWPFLWRFHVVHHADTTMDVTTGLRFHFVETALSTLIRVPVFILLGVQVEHLLMYELVVLPVVLFHHSNIRLPRSLDRVLRWVIVTPGMHWVHHSSIRAETNSNYSSLLSVWDRLFGSYRSRDDIAAVQLGVLGTEYTSLWRMLWLPLRSQPRRADAADSPAEKSG